MQVNIKDGVSKLKQTHQEANQLFNALEQCRALKGIGLFPAVAEQAASAHDALTKLIDEIGKVSG